MKKVLLLAILGLFGAVSAHAQVGQPDCIITNSFTTPGRVQLDNRGISQPVCTTWHLEYYVEGFSAVSIELDEAPSVGSSAGAWVVWPNVASGTLPLTATTSGQVTLFKYFPWVSINVTSLTGTGTLRAVAYGYRPFTSNDVNASPVSGGSNCNGAANGSPVSGNPCLVAGSDGTNVRSMFVSAAGTLQVGTTNISGADGVANNLSSAFLTPGNGTPMPLLINPSYFNGLTWDRAITCPNTSTFSVVSTITQVIAASGSTKIRICSFDINPSTTTAGSTDIVYGTGTNCGTGTTTLTGAYTLPAVAVVDITPATLSASSPLTTPASQAVCVRAVTSTVNGFIVWEQH